MIDSNVNDLNRACVSDIIERSVITIRLTNRKCWMAALIKRLLIHGVITVALCFPLKLTLAATYGYVAKEVHHESSSREGISLYIQLNGARERITSDFSASMGIIIDDVAETAEIAVFQVATEEISFSFVQTIVVGLGESMDFTVNLVFEPLTTSISNTTGPLALTPSTYSEEGLVLFQLNPVNGVYSWGDVQLTGNFEIVGESETVTGNFSESVPSINSALPNYEIETSSFPDSIVFFDEREGLRSNVASFASSAAVPIFTGTVDGVELSLSVHAEGHDSETRELIFESERDIPLIRDTDFDAVGDDEDVFPLDPNEWEDFDSDGIGNNSDSCPYIPNPGQEDNDGDGRGDVCDFDMFDWFVRADLDSDGTPDYYDEDKDADGLSDSAALVVVRASTAGGNSSVHIRFAAPVPDGELLIQFQIGSEGWYHAVTTASLEWEQYGIDINPYVTEVLRLIEEKGDISSYSSFAAFFSGLDRLPIAQPIDQGGDPFPLDTDNDGIENAADDDDDGDGVADAEDVFPLDQSETSDSDADGIGDNGDNCTNTPNLEQLDLDSDQIGDSCDLDIDGDGSRNDEDAFPYDFSETSDTDLDGVGDNADLDDDNDGLVDSEETMLGTNPLIRDTDGDSMPDGLEVEEGLNPLDQDDCPSWYCGGSTILKILPLLQSSQ